MKLAEPRLMKVGERWIVTFPISETASHNLDITADVSALIRDEHKRIFELENALRELAECDFAHGYSQDHHSATCRKCAVLRAITVE